MAQNSTAPARPAGVNRLTRCTRSVCGRVFTGPSCPFCALGPESRTAAGRASLRKSAEMLAMLQGLEGALVLPGGAKMGRHEQSWATETQTAIARVSAVTTGAPESAYALARREALEAGMSPVDAHQWAMLESK